MKKTCFLKCNSNHRRSVTLAWTAVSLTTILGFAALSVDLGYVELTQAQLRNAADAAALAGASAFNWPGQFSKSFTYNRDAVVSLAVSRAQEYAAKNSADGKPVVLPSSDILVGNLARPDDFNDTITTAVYPYNAVKVTIKKSTDNPNGPVKTFFAKIWGIHGVPASASATAVLNNHIGGYKARETGGALIPITIDKPTWNYMITDQNGPDSYSYDTQTGQVSKTPDGIPEIAIYPDKQKTDGTTSGAGNFGLLNFENGNNSANPLGDQISRGLTSEEVIRTIGTDTFTFYKEVITADNQMIGTPISYALNGAPGLKASLQSAFTSRIGTVVGIFINENVASSGSNCLYTITGIQYGILLAVDLTGMNKMIVFQPTVYVGPENIIDPNAPVLETGGRIVLVR